MFFQKCEEEAKSYVRFTDHIALLQAFNSAVLLRVIYVDIAIVMSVPGKPTLKSKTLTEDRVLEIRAPNPAH